jgi:hypothetical protein
MTAIGRFLSRLGRRGYASDAGSSPPASSAARLLAESDQDNARREILLTEWKEIRESLRYFGNKRFAQMTVFLAANALFFNAVYTGQGTLGRETVGIVGLAVAVLFLVLEYDSWRRWYRFAERGRRIEQQLVHLELIRYYRPASDAATWAAYAFYLLTAVG